MKSFRLDRRNLENEFKRAIARLQRNAEHDELFDDGGASMAQEEQLIGNTERLERTSRKLQDAYRVTVETEEVSHRFIPEPLTLSI